MCARTRQCIMHITERYDGRQWLNPVSGQKVCIVMSWLLVLSLVIPTSLSSSPDVVTCRQSNDYTICREEDVLVNVSQHGEANSLSIHDLSLIEVREDAFENLTATSLSLGHGNRISTLTKLSFRGLADLEELHLDNNRVSLKPYLFSELKKLKALYLSFNRIDHLPKHAFDGLPYLKWLFLRYNRLTSIEQDTFVDLTDLLQFLRLDNNRIGKIVPGSFEKLHELTHLHLEYNLISKILPGTFRGLKALTALFLDYNSLTNIFKGDFDDLDSLQMLNLQFNEIADIEPGSFDNLSSLRKLNLRRNKLTHITVGIFDKLAKLYDLDLSYNFIDIVDPAAFNSGNIESFHFIHNNLSDINENVVGLSSSTIIYS
ncbi:uncharacterized protein [Bombus fervidus]|uniref:uncharacterized protein n=1 Tax=Bombus fervidus TaxID=203811 RepID=UPI003AB4E1EE